ncbi:MAG TPA: hypothetical protein VIQ31_03255 [Phormidium sp.]
MQNYIKIAGKWHRRDPAQLDRLCEWQRVERLWQADPNFHYRKQAVASSFWWYLKNGKTRDEAYYIASHTQFIGLNSVALLNIDSRTTWVVELSK